MEQIICATDTNGAHRLHAWSSDVTSALGACLTFQSVLCYFSNTATGLAFSSTTGPLRLQTLTSSSWYSSLRVLPPFPVLSRAFGLMSYSHSIQVSARLNSMYVRFFPMYPRGSRPSAANADWARATLSAETLWVGWTIQHSGKKVYGSG